MMFPSFYDWELRKNLFFGTATATEAKDLDQRLRQIKAARQLPGQPFEIDEISFDVLHCLAARADQVVMRFEIAVHA
jgi:DNA-binding response OmpR family regulator